MRVVDRTQLELFRLDAVEDLRRYLQSRLPEYMIPSALVAVREFPLSPNGKVDRKALPTPQAADYHREREYVEATWPNWARPQSGGAALVSTSTRGGRGASYVAESAISAERDPVHHPGRAGLRSDADARPRSDVRARDGAGARDGVGA